MDTRVERVKLTVVPATPGWSVVGYYVDSATGKVGLWYEVIIAWRIETKEYTDDMQVKGQRYYDRRLRDFTEPIIAEGILDYDNDQFAAIRDPNGRYFSPASGWDDEKALLEELQAEADRKRAVKNNVPASN